MKKSILILTAVLFAAFTLNAQTKWSFDKSHSKVGFSVSHLVITDVDGQFHDYTGTITTDGENFENANIEFTIDVGSIDTDNTDRDSHLKSEDFFAADQYPQITFVGKSMEKAGDNKYKLTGDFTMRGVTKEVTLDVTHNGTVKDPWGNTKAGFTIEGSLDRFDYGLKWSNTLETGGLVVGKEVELEIDVQLKKES